MCKHLMSRSNWNLEMLLPPRLNLSKAGLAS